MVPLTNFSKSLKYIDFSEILCSFGIADDQIKIQIDI